MRVDPRAASATDTRAIVAVSGASTTLTKSKSPSVDHWCSTLAPSSSTSRFTSRRRSGFDRSVCTPWAVSVVSRMYVGMAAPRASGSGEFRRWEYAHETPKRREAPMAVSTPTHGILAEENRDKREQILELLAKAYWMEIETVMSYVANSVNPDGLRAQEIV